MAKNKKEKLFKLSHVGAREEIVFPAKRPPCVRKKPKFPPMKAWKINPPSQPTPISKSNIQSIHPSNSPSPNRIHILRW